MIMTSDNDRTQTSFKIFVQERGLFRRAVFTKEYSSVVTNDETDKCLFKSYCFKLVVYDSAGDGLQGHGSYEAYWNGKNLI